MTGVKQTAARDALKVINCARCNGQGVRLEPSGRWSMCAVCGGGGKVQVPVNCLICPLCKGDGSFGQEDEVCERCDGVGRVAPSAPILR